MVIDAGFDAEYHWCKGNIKEWRGAKDNCWPMHCCHKYHVPTPFHCIWTNYCWVRLVLKIIFHCIVLTECFEGAINCSEDMVWNGNKCKQCNQMWWEGGVGRIVSLFEEDAKSVEKKKIFFIHDFNKGIEKLVNIFLVCFWYFLNANSSLILLLNLSVGTWQFFTIVSACYTWLRHVRFLCDTIKNERYFLILIGGKFEEDLHASRVWI